MAILLSKGKELLCQLRNRAVGLGLVKLKEVVQRLRIRMRANAFFFTTGIGGDRVDSAEGQMCGLSLTVKELETIIRTLKVRMWLVNISVRRGMISCRYG
jgi:hypothetical protein